MTEEFNGVILKRAQAEAMKDLACHLEKNIPEGPIRWQDISFEGEEEPVQYKMGFLIEDENVIELGLCQRSRLYLWSKDPPEIEYSFDYNKLALIPNSFHQLSTLRKLYLHGNNLNYVPEWVKSLINLESLELIDLSYNKLVYLPEWFAALLDIRMDLRGNKIVSLPNSMSNYQFFRGSLILREEAEALKEVAEMTDPNIGEGYFPNVDNILREEFSPKLLKTVKMHEVGFVVKKGHVESLGFYNTGISEEDFPESMKVFKELKQLDLSGNGMGILPEFFQHFKRLEELDVSLSSSSSSSLPDFIGELSALKNLDLYYSSLRSFPESFRNLSNLEELNLRENKLESLPEWFIELKSLKTLILDGNPWKGEFKNVDKMSVNEIFDFLKKKSSINIFISHAVVNFEKFRINDTAKFLEQQKEVYQAYFCEEDLKGNIDSFMEETIPQCQLLLFMATQKSIFDSIDCSHELELARKNNIQIIPIKGREVDWNDLAKVGLNRELGLEFDADNFDHYCTDLYQYIYKFKRKIDLIDKEQGKIDKSILDTESLFEEFLKTPVVNELYKKNFSEIEQLKLGYKHGKISFTEYLKSLSISLRE